MTIHISARVAWHDHGWNGCVCRNLRANTYCVGQFTFPGGSLQNGATWNWKNHWLVSQPASDLTLLPLKAIKGCKRS
jgi:hypothetical protein